MNPPRALLFCAMLLTACATNAAGPWKVELTSSGGIAGRGNGGLTANSDGALEVTLMDGRRCSYSATDRRLGELIAEARPQRWAESYDAPCADCFEWTLTLTRGDSTYVTRWIEIAPDRPRDLVELTDALQAVKRSYGERCRGEQPK